MLTKKEFYSSKLKEKEEKIKVNPDALKYLIFYNSAIKEMREKPTQEKLEELQSIDGKIKACLT